MAKVYYVRSQGLWVAMPTKSRAVAENEKNAAQATAPVQLHVLCDDEAVVREVWPSISIREEP